jgi:Tfp pilus assembly PilM family ATPase
LARLLALDWDNHEFHLVAANVSRGRVYFERAIQWREETPFTAGQADQFGKRLRQRMSDAGISAAPIVVGLGRDRMVVKEIRYPQVDPSEEAALVRMQIVKELTDAAADVYIDYSPLPEGDKGGQRRALSLVVRKDVIHGIQDACRAAGLKLHAITARPFGIAACLRRVAGSHAQVPAPPAADAVVAVLTVARDWADFCAVRGEQLLFSRAMTSGDGLLGEVRRNLAAYAGQPQLSFPRDAIQALYVAGNGENAVLQEKLAATLGIPVHGIDPFVNEERIDVAANNRAGFTGAAGLLSLWAEHQAMPANFVKPRESKPVTSPAKKRVLVYGVLAAVVLGGALFGAFSVLAKSSAQERDLREQKAAADKRLRELQPEAKYIEALKEWVDGDISDLDEMFDLVARAPWVQGFRISKFEKTVVQQPKSAKDKEKFLVHVIIKGRIFRKDQRLLQNWVDAINKDPHCKAKSDKINTITNAADPDMSVQEFEVIIDIARQPATAYTTTYSPPGKR